MKKLIQLQYILLVLTICAVEAQEFQGSAFYFAKTNVNTDFTKNIPIERRQYVIDRIKRNSEKNYQLDFGWLLLFFLRNNVWKPLGQVEEDLVGCHL